MTQPLRVLLVEPEGHEGHWHYTVTLAQALQRRGVDVRLATLFPYERMEGIDETQVFIICRRGHSTGRKPWRLGLRIPNHAEKVAKLAQVLWEFRPTIVHLQGTLGRLDFSYFGLMKLFGARVVYTAHDPTPSHWLKVFDRLRYHTADRVLVHSWNGVADLKSYGVDESRIVQIPHVSFHHLAGNGTVPREEAKASLGLPAGASVLLFFGHIEPRKGLDLLLDAHGRLSHKHSNIYLIVAGRPLEDFRHYMDQIASSSLSDRVILDLRYIPFDRMQVYFSAADVVVLPYRRIHQSGVLQWAYAFGRPVVVTDVGGISEAVTADGTGVIASALEGDALAGAILSLLTNSKLACEMGERGRLFARTKYSSERVAEKLEDVYRELAAASPPHS